MSQNSEEAPVPVETPMNFAKFLRTTLKKKKLWTTASETQTLQ